MSGVPADEKPVTATDEDLRQWGAELPDGSAAVGVAGPAAPAAEAAVTTASATAAGATSTAPNMRSRRSSTSNVSLEGAVAAWQEMLTSEAQLAEDLEKRRRVVLARHDPTACLKLLQGTSKLLADEFYRAIARHRRVEAAILVQASKRQRCPVGAGGQRCPAKAARAGS